MTALDRVRDAYPPLTDPDPPPATVARLQALYAGGSAATAQHSRRGPVRRRRRTRSRRIGLLAVGGVVLSGSAIAATGGWHPVLGSAAHRPRPLAARTGVPADQLAALAILRRPQTAADRGPLVRSALQVLVGQVITGIHTDAIRVIFRDPQEFSVLIPAESSGPHIKGHPSFVQHNVLCLMSSSFQKAQTLTTTSGGKPKTLFHSPAGYGNWGGTCGGLGRLRTTGIETGTNPDGGGLVLTGHPERVANRRITLVPDGVARVKVRLRGGKSVIVPVRDNVYEYMIHGISAYLGTTWYDAHGHRIERHTHR